ncbi:MAG TPA: 2-amino-4-hydroxy-6-hydroxymethyldihydropteridine diphosphokinase [Gemmatimonadales bacterium]|nr:2-amino-4-hydroxy-6-hydroxymethyldihydropteridine diphosphokinase [Gemmatimonadales bacterium]
MSARARAYVALGSNLGDRGQYLALARDRLARLPGTRLRAVSRVEETEPLGGLDQPPYLNQMVELDTTLSPRDLLAECQRIEAEAGRKSRVRWAPRTLDLDIVEYGHLELDEPGLRLPHPGIRTRAFWQRELEELRGGRDTAGR